VDCNSWYFYLRHALDCRFGSASVTSARGISAARRNAPDKDVAITRVELVAAAPEGTALVATTPRGILPGLPVPLTILPLGCWHMAPRLRREWRSFGRTTEQYWATETRRFDGNIASNSNRPRCRVYGSNPAPPADEVETLVRCKTSHWLPPSSAQQVTGMEWYSR
jgi:hypothetical protein